MAETGSAPVVLLNEFVEIDLGTSWADPSLSRIRVISAWSMECFRLGFQEVQYVIYPEEESSGKNVNKSLVSLQVHQIFVRLQDDEDEIEKRETAQRQHYGCRTRKDLVNQLKQKQIDLDKAEADLLTYAAPPSSKVKHRDMCRVKRDQKKQALEQFDRQWENRQDQSSLEEWCARNVQGEPCKTERVVNTWGFENSLEHYLSMLEGLPFKTPGNTGYVIYRRGSDGKERRQFVADAQNIDDAVDGSVSCTDLERLLKNTAASSNANKSEAARWLQILHDASYWSVNATMHNSERHPDRFRKHLNVVGMIEGRWQHLHIYCYRVKGDCNRGEAVEIPAVEAHGIRSHLFKVCRILSHEDEPKTLGNQYLSHQEQERLKNEGQMIAKATQKMSSVGEKTKKKLRHKIREIKGELQEDKKAQKKKVWFHRKLSIMRGSEG
ncbi:unnamed protein product [Symbiodinium pilosum]|uniref:Uncharacterized protein n=1 Tax=Symbiodinium pilosum TaxID=2952 RepID=A0A812X7P1_SYMPI|nr:unnamed protein product [Symbiodinium pilosum]